MPASIAKPKIKLTRAFLFVFWLVSSSLFLAFRADFRCSYSFLRPSKRVNSFSLVFILVSYSTRFSSFSCFHFACACSSPACFFFTFSTTTCRLVSNADGAPPILPADSTPSFSQFSKRSLFPCPALFSFSDTSEEISFSFFFLNKSLILIAVSSYSLFV